MYCDAIIIFYALKILAAELLIVFMLFLGSNILNWKLKSSLKYRVLKALQENCCALLKYSVVSQFEFMHILDLDLKNQ